MIASPSSPVTTTRARIGRNTASSEQARQAPASPVDTSGLASPPAIDYSVSRAIEDMIVDTLARDRQVLMTLPEGDVARMLEREGVLEALPRANVHPDRAGALKHAGEIIALLNTGSTGRLGD